MLQASLSLQLKPRLIDVSMDTADFIKTVASVMVETKCQTRFLVQAVA
jgi:hypothetical protein